MQVLKTLTQAACNTVVWAGLQRFSVPMVTGFVRGDVLRHEGGTHAIVEYRLAVPALRWAPEPARPLHYHELPAHEFSCYAYEKLVRCRLLSCVFRHAGLRSHP